MSELFVNQSLLSLSAPTGYDDLASADETKILYRKPSGITGSWNATVNGTDLTYNLVDGDIDERGMWQFQSYVLVGTLKGFGNLRSKFFKNPLT